MLISSDGTETEWILMATPSKLAQAPGTGVMARNRLYNVRRSWLKSNFPSCLNTFGAGVARRSS